jgi:hypothetical protein
MSLDFFSCQIEPIEVFVCHCGSGSRIIDETIRVGKWRSDFKRVYAAVH